MIVTGELHPAGDLCSNLNAMKTNMGSTDRIVRLLLVVVVTVLYLTGIIGGTLAAVLLALCGVFLLTSLLAFCPLYLPFGISTARK